MSISNFKYLLLTVLGLFFVSAIPLHALDKKRTSKVEKICKKECKQLKKEGWKVYGKAQELDEAILNYYIALEEGSDSLHSVVSTAEDRDINQAKNKAHHNAMNQLASMRESLVEGVTTVETTNEQGSDGVKSNTSMVNSTKTSVKQQVKALKPILTLSRKKSDDKTEIRMYYLVNP